MTNINARSPYYVYLTESLLESATMEMYVYTGTKVFTMPSTTYSLNSTAINEEITFEIGELVRDYLVNEFNGNYVSEAVWVNYQITRTVDGTVQSPGNVVNLKAFDGYGYFSDGSQNQSTDINDQIVLMSNEDIFTYDRYNFIIPLSGNQDLSIHFYNKGVEQYSYTITETLESDDIIRYVETLEQSGELFKNRVLADGGSIGDLDCLGKYFDSMVNMEVDTVYVVDEDGDISVVRVKEQDECKYKPYKITFVNKFGAYQDLWFFKKSKLSLSSKAETYKSNVVNEGAFSINAHQSKIYTKNGKEKLSMNTGFYPESYNEIFTQFSLSEEVWIDYEGKTLPVNVKTGGFTHKTQLNDKLIDYTIEVEFAFDKINNVR